MTSVAVMAKLKQIFSFMFAYNQQIWIWQLVRSVQYILCLGRSCKNTNFGKSWVVDNVTWGHGSGTWSLYW